VDDSSPTIGVLALQGDVREHLAMLERSGARPIAVRRPGELAQVHGIVIPGGESTTMYKLARTFELFEPLRSAVRAGLPAFGTCAGMIMLADHIESGTPDQETIGGLDVVVRRNAFGRQVDSFEADVEVDPGVVGGVAPGPDGGPAAGPDGRPDEGSGRFVFKAVFIRAPWVEKVGDGVVVVARVSSGGQAGRIVAVRQGSLLATSFHPEISGDSAMHRVFVDLVRERLASTPRPEQR
jgi:pyridoxal 5'-phosphate synthase pdxT subunit